MFTLALLLDHLTVLLHVILDLHPLAKWNANHRMFGRNMTLVSRREMWSVVDWLCRPGIKQKREKRHMHFLLSTELLVSTSNGEFYYNIMSEKFQDRNIPIDGKVVEVFPFAGLYLVGSMVEANFGQNCNKPFKYNVWKHLVPWIVIMNCTASISMFHLIFLICPWKI